MRTRNKDYDSTRRCVEMAFRQFVCCLAVCMAVLPVTASERPVLGGYVRGQAWYAHQASTFNALYGECALKVSGHTGAVFYASDVRARDGLFFNERQTLLELKEAYVGYRTSWFETSLGKQIYGWGRVEGFNPTNNLTVYDYFRLSDQPDDQKLGVFQWLLSVRPIDASTLTLVWQPLFTPSIYRYELFDMGQGVTFTDPVKPKPNLGQGNLSLRWNVEVPAVGFSLSYFNGYDPYHGINLVGFDLQPTPQLTYQPAYFRKQSIGADLALPIGSVIFRAEAAYDLSSDDADRVYLPKSDLNAVVGLETVLWGVTTLAQYQATFTSNWEAPVIPVLTNPSDPVEQYAFAYAMARYETALFNRKIMHQEKASQHALMLSLQRNLAFETLSLSVTGLYDLTTREYIVRPELAWSWTDALTFKWCGVWMDGPVRSLYDYAGKVLAGLGVGLTVTF